MPNEPKELVGITTIHLETYEVEQDIVEYQKYVVPGGEVAYEMVRWLIYDTGDSLQTYDRLSGELVLNAPKR